MPPFNLKEYKISPLRNFGIHLDHLWTYTLAIISIASSVSVQTGDVEPRNIRAPVKKLASVCICMCALHAMVTRSPSHAHPHMLTLICSPSSRAWGGKYHSCILDLIGYMPINEYTHALTNITTTNQYNHN